MVDGKVWPWVMVGVNASIAVIMGRWVGGGTIELGKIVYGR